MKNILKRIFVFSIVLLLTISNANGIEVFNSMKTHKINPSIEIYEVKAKEEVIVNNGIVDFYENDPNKSEILEYIEYKKEQERLEQERIARLEFKSNLANYAKQFVGNPYVSGGNSLTNGTDCSGFVKLIYAKYGYELPRTTPTQAVVGIEVSMDELEVGDIVSYGYDGAATHSAIYIGNGMIVHSSTPELGIRIDNINIMPILTLRRVII